MNELKNQCVRDLAWALGSPPLVSGEAGHCLWPDRARFRQLAGEARPWLRQQDAQPQALQALLDAQKDRRLGRYFETLWYYWLEQHPRYQVLARNLQIVIEGETLGEMDFIVYDRVKKKTLHIEVAVKFYLGESDTRRMCNWRGPDRHDRFDRKVDHLRQRQSVISRDARVRPWLQCRGFRIDACRVILKGRLYYPWSGTLNRGGAEPAGAAGGHLRGVWFSPDQFEAHFDDRARFRILMDRGRLSEMPAEGVGKLYSKSAVISALRDKKCRVSLHIGLQNPHQNTVFAFLTGM